MRPRRNRRASGVRHVDGDSHRLRALGGQTADSGFAKTATGKAWRDLKAWITQPLRETETLALPGVSEAYLAWTFSGEAEFQEREGNGPWITHRIKKGSFFLTTGGGPYDCRWRALTPEPFLSMMTFVELPLLKRALEEVFGAKADRVRLRDMSAFTDPDLNWLMEGVRSELMARRASVLRVQGLAHPPGAASALLNRVLAHWRRPNDAVLVVREP